jgi:hypothetical protein
MVRKGEVGKNRLFDRDTRKCRKRGQDEGEEMMPLKFKKTYVGW